MIVLDVTELVSNPVRAGIQRVVRELIRHWPIDVPMRVARYDAAEGLVAVPDDAIELILDNTSEVAGLPDTEIGQRVAQLLGHYAPKLPSDGHAFVPEAFFEGRRCAYYQDRLFADPTSVGFIVYDFIPWLHPERIGVTQSTPLMPYLRLLRTAHRLAFISIATRNDYAQRVMRGYGVDGPVLSLGCDGLGLARQAFTPDRRGYLCIGSIDGRKNQDRVLLAFQLLWERGHEIPLTMVGYPFPQIDTTAFQVARAHPQFVWHCHADDETVRDLFRSARGTIYASELEGYGLPPVESLHAGLPVICAASVPSIADLPPAGQLRLAQVTPEAIAEAVLALSDETTCARLWEEARGLALVTWNAFARQAADWMESVSSSCATAGHAAEHRASEHLSMNFADMYAWWNQAARDNPMTAILSNDTNWDHDKFFETGKTWLAEHRAFTAGAGITLKGGRAMDFGCGVGRMSAALAEHYDEVVGVDISDEMVRLAELLRPCANTRFLQVVEPPLPFHDQEFDCVYSTIVVQHVPFPYSLRYLGEFFRVSSGLVLMDAPSHTLKGQPPGSGIFLLNLQQVLACATQSGFDIVGLREFPATATRHYQYLFRRVCTDGAG